MGLFDKKYCDFCGNKIGLLGNRKFEDGNMCKDCAAKLSPWFDERRHSTKQTLTEQLEAREANKAAVAAFGATRKLGKYTKLVIDEVNRKFMVTSSNNYEKDNPDVFDFSQARGCDLSISESRTELKTKNAEGKSISYNPPRYEYSYNFYATISVNHPYVDDMKFSITNGYIKTGERRMDGASTGWRMDMRMPASLRIQAYNDAIDLGNEIKEAVEDMRRIANGSRSNSCRSHRSFHSRPCYRSPSCQNSVPLLRSPHLPGFQPLLRVLRKQDSNLMNKFLKPAQPQLCRLSAEQS